MAWTYVIDESAIPEGDMAPVYPLGVNVVVARVEGAFYAVAGKCAHMACPLYTGTLRRYILTCGCHEWSYDIRTGRFLAVRELGVPVYPVKAESGRLFVDLDAKENSNA